MDTGPSSKRYPLRHKVRYRAVQTELEVVQVPGVSARALAPQSSV